MQSAPGAFLESARNSAQRPRRKTLRSATALRFQALCARASRKGVKAIDVLPDSERSETAGNGADAPLKTALPEAESVRPRDVADLLTTGLV